MVSFKISDGPEWAFGGYNTVASMRLAKLSLTSRATNWTAGMNVTLTVGFELNHHQLCNFVALIGKTWENWMFMVHPTRGQAPNNPWPLIKRSANFDVTLLSVPLVEVLPLPGGVVLKVLTGASTADAICAFTWRMTNMAEWCLKFGGEVKLTSDTRLIQSTFDSITRDIRAVSTLVPRTPPEPPEPRRPLASADLRAEREVIDQEGDQD